MRARPPVHTLLAAVSGACILGYSPPHELDVLGFLAFPLWLLALERAPLSATAGARTGALVGFTANAIALYSTVPLVRDFGGLPTAVAVFASALLWLWQAAPYALAGAATQALGRAGVPRSWALPAAFTVASTLTPVLFPWRAGSGLSGQLLWVQMADLGGEALLDFFLALTGIAALELVRAHTRRSRAAWLIVTSLAVALPLGYGAARLPSVRAERAAGRALRVGIVQPCATVPEKRDPAKRPERLALLQSLTGAAEGAGAELVVWPETAYPYRLSRTRRREPKDERRILTGGVRGPLLLGAVSEDAEGRTRNSTFAVDAAGAFHGVADKVHLLAFGEYTPLWDYLPFLQSRTSRGHLPGAAPALLRLEGVKFAVINCYEDLLSAFVRRIMPLGPELLVNVTNDAWFGDTNEPYLHQTMARVRAVETRRDLIRSVNSGVSSHVLATGEDAVRTESWVRTWFVSEARLLSGTTVWVRVGDWVTPVLAAWLLALVLRARLTSRGRTAPRTPSARTSP